MGLIVYPAAGYDSYVSLVDAENTIISYTTFGTQWLALDDATKEVYLRIATARINDVIDSVLLNGIDACLSGSCSMMAVHDLVFSISSSVNANDGLITKEKVGDLEVQYQHSYNKRSSRNTNPFPPLVRTCLIGYGAEFSSITRATLEKR